MQSHWFLCAAQVFTVAIQTVCCYCAVFCKFHTWTFFYIPTYTLNTKALHEDIFLVAHPSHPCAWCTLSIHHFLIQAPCLTNTSDRHANSSLPELLCSIVCFAQICGYKLNIVMVTQMTLEQISEIMFQYFNCPLYHIMCFDDIMFDHFTLFIYIFCLDFSVTKHCVAVF